LNPNAKATTQSKARAVPENSTPPAVPDYELLRRIGSGSYGEVWLARSASGVYRAVKVVYRSTFEHNRPFERELSGIRKFEPVSRAHPSQVNILCVGHNEAAGYFYYVMELADDANAEGEPNAECGMRNAESPPNTADAPHSEFRTSHSAAVPHSAFPIPHLTATPHSYSLRTPHSYVPKTLKSELAKHGRLPYQQCLEIGLSLTKALDHLHQHGLIHRDIKPSNVIFVNGVPKLADIGLVTDVGATISYVGTEGFLPPEGPGTPQADIYSLGKVLYEISTGRDRLEFPELPTLLGAPEEKQGLYEVNLVFLKACQNEVRKRYQSAREMSADLALLQSGKSLRRARALEQKLASLTRLGLAAGAAVLVAAGAYYYRNELRLKQLRQDVGIAEKARRMSDNRTAQTRQNLANVYASSAKNVAAQGDLFDALLWLSHAVGSDTDPTNRQAHLRDLDHLLQSCPKTLAIIAAPAKLNWAAFSPDGRRLITASDDQTAQLWDASTGQPIGSPLKHAAPVNQAWFDVDGQRVVTASADGTAQVWNALTGEAISSPLKHGGNVLRAIFSPDGRQVLTFPAVGQASRLSTKGPDRPPEPPPSTGGSADEAAAIIWEASSGRPRFTLRHRQQVLDAAFSPDGRYVATGSADLTAQVWSMATGEPASAPLHNQEPVSHVAFSPDSRRLVTSSGAQAQVWNAAAGTRANFILRHDATISSVSFSPDGRQVLTASEDQTVRLWDTITGKRSLGPLWHQDPVQRVLFSPDGQQILSVSGNQIRLWNARTGEALAPIFLLNAPVVVAQFSADGGRLAIVGEDHSVRIVETFPRSSTAIASSSSKDRPLEDCVSLAELLCARQVDTNTQQAVAIKSDGLRNLWAKLRQKYPEEFEPADLPAWHRQAAEKSETARHWFGARFHWDCLLKRTPADNTIRERRDHAVDELARSESSENQLVQAPEPRRIMTRPAEAKAGLIDLTAYYNAALGETWFPTNIIRSGNDLSALPSGLQKFGGVEFDVRGIIQLSGSVLEDMGAQFPRQVNGIKINQKCQRLHFLQGTGWDALFGTTVGRYQINYANGEKREIKLVFGQNIRDWWFFATQRQPTSGATLAWQGSNPASQALGMALRLYQMSWVNPLPEVEIASIDFISTMEKSAPFLIALTVE